jgi:hypothetical protein
MAVGHPQNRIKYDGETQIVFQGFGGPFKAPVTQRKAGTSLF